MWLKKVVKSIIFGFFSLFPLQDMILLESVPCYTDNTKAVFDELLRRGWNRKYRFIWLYMKKEEVPEVCIPNVSFLNMDPRNPFLRLRDYYLLCTARLIICCNNSIGRRRTGGVQRQYAIYLSHGGALKDCSSHSGLPDGVDGVAVFSPYLAPYDAKNQHYDVTKALPLGYPRNDALFAPPLDTAALFPEASFQKLIYWLPTYRQRWDNFQVSSISMPILYDEAIAEEVNACAREQGVLVVVKPHFAQDLSKLKVMRLSNLVFIDEAFLRERHILNYDLLRSADAMLTDYSSVYYDYLLLNRPIGLCWDDYEEYRKNEGFQINPDVVLAGGEKLYNAGNLCAFIKSVAAGEDPLREQREQILDMIHLHKDGQSAKRVADHLEEVLRTL